MEEVKEGLDWYDGFSSEEDVKVYERIFKNRGIKCYYLKPRKFGTDDYDLFINEKEFNNKFSFIARIVLFFGFYSSKWLSKKPSESKDSGE